MSRLPELRRAQSGDLGHQDGSEGGGDLSGVAFGEEGVVRAAGREGFETAIGEIAPAEARVFEYLVADQFIGG